MLFLDTCTVNAQGFGELFDSILVNNYAQSNSFSLTVTPTSSTSYQYVISTNGSFTDSGTISSISGVPSSYRGSGSFTITNLTSQYDNEYYQAHFKIPFSIYAPPDSGQSVVLKDTYGFVAYGSTPSCTVGSLQNVCYTSGNDIIYNQGNSHFPVYMFKGYELFDANAVQTYVGRTCYLEFDYVFYSGDYDLTDNDAITTYISFTSTEFIGHVNNNLDLNTVEVQDSVTRQEVTELSDTASDTNTKITDFFGSFFDNLIHIFVPEDGYLSTWFDKLNTLLSDKLGMLYAPFDLIISTLQAIYSSSTTESGIPFPGIKWEDTWLVEPFTFTFDSLGDSFDDLRVKVYFATDTVLVLTFLMLLQSKVRLILEGHE